MMMLICVYWMPHDEVGAFSYVAHVLAKKVQILYKTTEAHTQKGKVITPPLPKNLPVFTRGKNEFTHVHWFGQDACATAASISKTKATFIS